MQPIRTFRGRAIPLPASDIDTDQIIPARYLKTIDKQGLGSNLFQDWRYLADGGPNPDFVLNQPPAQGATILVAGDNFGCGSSREHAPWALLGFGFRAVISTSFADIFQNNCLKNGLLPVVVDRATHAEIMGLAEKDGSVELKIDLANQKVHLPGGREAGFPIDPFAKRCLLEGMDQLVYLRRQREHIEAYEQENPPRVNTL